MSQRKIGPVTIGIDEACLRCKERLGRKIAQNIKGAPNSFESRTPGSPPPELLTVENKVGPAHLPMALPCHVEFTRNALPSL